MHALSDDAGRLPDVLTTGQAAQLARVGQTTIIRWFDAGLLKGYRVPLSKCRRIPLAALVAFLGRHGAAQALDGVDDPRCSPAVPERKES